MTSTPDSRMSPLPDSATAITQRVKSGAVSAVDTVNLYLDRIDELNPKLNCYTLVTKDRAMAKAKDIDRRIAAGKDPGPLAGVPFAVKNLYDIQGAVTLAGSKINADNPAAEKDALLIQRMERAGAILLGGLAMGEYAYDFTGENQHYGACRNPWDLERMSGGSSSGSGSATAAGLAPISLGSDTNGSIRVPASLCGLFGMKPTFGRLPRTGTYPFCDSLDHLGPLARSAQDLALSFGVLQDSTVDVTEAHYDPSFADKPLVELAISADITADLRVAQAGGFFDCQDFPDAQAAVQQVADALQAPQTLELEGAKEGRAAAYLITNAESSTLHLERLRARAEDFDDDTRERFLAGALIPANWYLKAQEARRWWQNKMLAVFADVDLIIAPATPCTAPLLGTRMLKIGDKEQLLRPNLGLFSQPFSSIGLPVVTVPIWLEDRDLPIGVQLVAPPWREDVCLAAAAKLEALGVAQCRVPKL